VIRMMQIDSKKLLQEVPDYKDFLTLKEMDERALVLAKKYGFAMREVGRSANNHPMYLIVAGNGPRRAFVWGFPHPNEAIGSWTVDWLINFFGQHPEMLKEWGYAWYFLYTADPDGTSLNEGWFKADKTLFNYILHYYRPINNYAGRH